jgi:hypothetical protein
MYCLFLYFCMLKEAIRAMGVVVVGVQIGFRERKHNADDGTPLDVAQ